MDKRDRYNKQHMAKRLKAASKFPLDRRIRCAKHLMEVALHQHRVHLLMMAAMWEHKLEDEENKDEKA